MSFNISLMSSVFVLNLNVRKHTGCSQSYDIKKTHIYGRKNYSLKLKMKLLYIYENLKIFYENQKLIWKTVFYFEKSQIIALSQN